MAKKPHAEQPEVDIAGVSQRIADMYSSMHLLKYSTKPPFFTPEQAATPDIVYHGLPNHTSVHIGLANAENTPAHLAKWRAGAEAKFVLWHNRHQRQGTVSTPYYIGETTGDISQPFIVTPKDTKRFRSLTPEADDNSRWQSFIEVVKAVERLELPKPVPESVELTA